jgi:hypothetical protein
METDVWSTKVMVQYDNIPQSDIFRSYSLNDNDIIFESYEQESVDVIWI